MKLVACLCIISLFGIGSCLAAVKTVSQLTTAEKESLDYLVIKIYASVSPEGGTCPVLYDTKFNALPRQDGRRGADLAKPVILVSAACQDSFMSSGPILKIMREAMGHQYTAWKDAGGKTKTLRIIGGYISPGPMGMYPVRFGMVTIIPTLVEIK